MNTTEKRTYKYLNEIIGVTDAKAFTEQFNERYDYKHRFELMEAIDANNLQTYKSQKAIVFERYAKRNAVYFNSGVYMW